LRLAVRTLDSVSPLATLDRGYAIVSDDETGAILTDAAKIKPGSDIRAQLAHGMLQATVKESGTGKSSDP
jgi:exodeoxyribonuclease VII large subunit